VILAVEKFCLNGPQSEILATARMAFGGILSKERPSLPEIKSKRTWK